MKKLILLITIILSMTLLTGCGKDKYEVMSENLAKMELTGNLVTYQAYYHNVLEYKKDAGSGLAHIFERDRKMFAEYTGTIKLGVNLSKVKVDVVGDKINVFMPKATIIGEPNVDEEDFKPENFIESKDSWINSNPITADDSSKAFDEAQAEMKKNVLKDEQLLDMAQKRAKDLIEENIKQFSGISSDDYTINWQYEE